MAKKFEKEIEAQLKQLILEETGVQITTKQSDKLINKLEGFLKETIEAGESIQWTGFITIKPDTRGAYTGRNPKTGEPVEVPAKKTIRVSASKAWKRDLNK